MIRIRCIQPIMNRNNIQLLDDQIKLDLPLIVTF